MAGQSWLLTEEGFQEKEEVEKLTMAKSPLIVPGAEASGLVAPNRAVRVGQLV